MIGLHGAIKPMRPPELRRGWFYGSPTHLDPRKSAGRHPTTAYNTAKHQIGCIMAGRNWILCGALLAALAVVAGALGTHFLKDRLRPPEAVGESDSERISREFVGGELPLAGFYDELIKSAGADRLF